MNNVKNDYNLKIKYAKKLIRSLNIRNYYNVAQTKF